METTIDHFKKNYPDALDVLTGIYNSYRTNQLLQADDLSVRFMRLLPTGINTMGYPAINMSFLESLRDKVQVLIMPTQETTNYEPDRCTVAPSLEVDAFCKERGLERALRAYINVACRIFEDAEITLSVSKDPEIENYIKVCFNIRIKADIQALLQKDKEFFKAIESVISDEEKDFFVKTYEIIE